MLFMQALYTSTVIQYAISYTDIVFFKFIFLFFTMEGENVIKASPKEM